MQRPEQAPCRAASRTAPAPQIESASRRAIAPPIAAPPPCALTFDRRDHRLVQARHADHDRAAARPQRVPDLRAADAGRQHDRRADRERRQQPDGQRIGVVQRQRQQRRSPGPARRARSERIEVGREIGVAERHALGRAGGARGIGSTATGPAELGRSAASLASREATVAGRSLESSGTSSRARDARRRVPGRGRRARPW